jgi:predicted DNA-binding transcriptional regulator AlpA
MIETIDRRLQLPEIAKMFGLSEESIKRLAKTHNLPLRRVTPFATPGTLESELVRWLKTQPRVGPPVRSRNGKNGHARVKPDTRR